MAIAHRGASADHPENTLVAFDAALRHPVEAIELDLQRSRDGAVVVFHDRTLGKYGAPRRRVAGMTLKELHRLDAGAWKSPRFAGTAMATLDQVLDRYGGRVPLMLEVKLRGGKPSLSNHLRLAREVARMVADRGLLEWVYMLSFGLPVLEAARREVPSLRCIWNVERPPAPSVLGRRMKPLFGLCGRVEKMTRPVVERLHGENKSVLVYTCNTDQQVDHARVVGVDGVISDRPGWLCRHAAMSTRG